MPAFPEFQVKPVEVGTGKDGLPVFEDQEWVKIRVDSKTTLEKVVDDQTKKQFPDHYKAWKANEEAPIEGYDLRQCPFIVKEQIDYCHKVGVRSVEQLLAASESELAAIPRARDLQNKARAFIDAAKDTGKVSAEVAKLRKDMKHKDSVIADQKETLDALRKRVESLEAKGSE